MLATYAPPMPILVTVIAVLPVRFARRARARG
jgi:hypothetical protein